MELDLVDSVPVAVDGVQPRRGVVGEAPPLLRLGAARAPAELEQRGLGDAEPAYAVGECSVGGEDVVVDERRRLVGHLVSHRGTSPSERTQNATSARTSSGSAADDDAAGESGPTSASPIAPTS